MSLRCKTVLKSSVVAVTLALAPMVVSANTIDSVINLQSQSLVVSLAQVAKQHHLQIFVKDSLIRNMSAPAVRSANTAKQAVAILLQGSNLQAVWQSETNLVITKKSVSIEKAASGIKAGNYVDVEGLAYLEKIIVNGDRLGRYRSVEANSTLRTNVDLLDMSRSIQVINRDMIDDVDVRSLNDALQFVSGTAERHRMGGVDTQYYIRGFRESATYRNGKREGFSTRVNMNTVETVEVLKGPASVQFGVNSPGGIVNYNTKKPQAENFSSFKVRLDEHGKKEFISDITGATNATGNVLFRFIAAAEDSESYRDFTEQNSYTFAPSLSFILSEYTQFNIALELNHTELPVDRGIPFALHNDGEYRIVDVPIERTYSEPNDHSVDDRQFIDLSLNHEFNSHWRGEISYAYQNWQNNWTDTQQDDFFLYGGEVDGITYKPGDLIRGVYGYTDREQTTYQLSAIIFGDFELANMAHKLSLGVDYGKTEMAGTWGEGAIQPSEEFPTIFNIYQPVYGNLPTGLTPEDTPETENEDNWGLFINNTSYLSEDLIVNLALRYNSYDEQSSCCDGWVYKAEDTALVYNAGLLYKFNDDLSIYSSYATSYQPNSAANVVGKVKPSEGKQWEFGIKGLAFENSIQYSLVYYDIAKTNIANDVETLDGREVVKLVGEQTSQGIELDVSWLINDELSIMANYAYTDAQVSIDKENPDYVGNIPEGIPVNSGSVYATYQFNELIPQLSLFVGASFADDVPNDEDNKFFLPGYTKFDLGINYTMPFGEEDSLVLQAGIKNLTDEAIYLQNGHDAVGIGQVRTLYANIDYRF